MGHATKGGGRELQRKARKLVQLCKAKKGKTQTEIGLKKAKQASRKENMMTETRAEGYDLAGISASRRGSKGRPSWQLLKVKCESDTRERKNLIKITASEIYMLVTNVTGKRQQRERERERGKERQGERER